MVRTLETSKMSFIIALNLTLFMCVSGLPNMAGSKGVWDSARRTLHYSWERWCTLGEIRLWAQSDVSKALHYGTKPGWYGRGPLVDVSWTQVRWTQRAVDGLMSSRLKHMSKMKQTERTESWDMASEPDTFWMSVMLMKMSADSECEGFHWERIRDCYFPNGAVIFNFLSKCAFSMSEG